MTRKRFIKLCMGLLHLSRNQAAAAAESRGLTYHMLRMAISMQECAQAFARMSCLVAHVDSGTEIRYRHVKSVRDGVIEYDE